MQILAASPAWSFGQQIASLDAPAAAPTASSGAAAISAVPTPNKKEPLTGRWLDLKTLSHTERYRSAFELGGFHDFENAQARSLIQGEIKLDSQGRYPNQWGQEAQDAM